MDTLEWVGAFRATTAKPKPEEIERMRSKARHAEASALLNAEDRGEELGIKRGIKLGAETERAKWLDVVSDKDSLIAELRARLGE